MNTSNFLHDHIDYIDSEITWTSDEKLKKEFSEKNIKFNKQNIILSNGFELEVFFDSFEYFELLQEKFTFITSKTKNSLGTLYFVSSNEVSDLGNISLQDKEAFVIGDGFGILKSAISGFATLILGLNKSILPVHGSAISSKVLGGLSFIGGHRVGKTTGLLNIADILGNGEIVSDDWLLANFDNGILNVTTTDNSISLAEKSLAENPHIKSINTPEIQSDIKKRKRSYKPEELLGNGFLPHKNDIQIDNIILPIKGYNQAITKLLDYKYVPEFILGSTYHFPYFSHDLKNQHIESWKKGLQESNLNVLVFDYTKFKNTIEGYKRLINYIIEGKM